MNNTYYKRPNSSGKKHNGNNTGNNEGVYEEAQSSYYQPNYQAKQYGDYDRQIKIKQSTGKDLVSNIVLVLLSVTLVIAILTLGAEVSDIDRHYERDANSFWWAYESGNYVDTIRDRYENIYNDVRETAELTQCYAVSEYFEAASLYKSAIFVGKEDKATEYLEAMKEAYLKMGDVSYLAEDINDRLGITDIAN